MIQLRTVFDAPGSPGVRTTRRAARRMGLSEPPFKVNSPWPNVDFMSMFGYDDGGFDEPVQPGFLDAVLGRLGRYTPYRNARTAAAVRV